MAMESHQDIGPRHEAEERTAVEARQGVISGRVLLVLLTSLVLAIIAITIGWYVMR
jgi:hypothetical protein